MIFYLLLFILSFNEILSPFGVKRKLNTQNNEEFDPSEEDIPSKYLYLTSFDKVQDEIEMKDESEIKNSDSMEIEASMPHVENIEQYKDKEWNKLLDMFGWKINKLYNKCKEFEENIDRARDKKLEDIEREYKNKIDTKNIFHSKMENTSYSDNLHEKKENIEWEYDFQRKTIRGHALFSKSQLERQYISIIAKEILDSIQEFKTKFGNLPFSNIIRINDIENELGNEILQRKKLSKVESDRSYQLRVFNGIYSFIQYYKFGDKKVIYKGKYRLYKYATDLLIKGIQYPDKTPKNFDEYYCGSLLWEKELLNDCLILRFGFSKLTENLKGYLKSRIDQFY